MRVENTPHFVHLWLIAWCCIFLDTLLGGFGARATLPAVSSKA